MLPACPCAPLAANLLQVDSSEAALPGPGAGQSPLARLPESSLPGGATS